MIRISQCAFVLSSVGLLAVGHAAFAQPNLTTSSCQAQLDAVASEWNAVGLPAAPAEGGFQAKAGMIKLKNGYATSAANFQYMAVQLHQAADACHAGDAGTASQKVALIRDRLDSMAR